MPDINAKPEMMLELTCYNAIHLGEWAVEIQIFDFA